LENCWASHREATRIRIVVAKAFMAVSYGKNNLAWELEIAPGRCIFVGINGWSALFWVGAVISR